jgi:hypothetical protein
MNCLYCGNKIFEYDRFCPSCGAPNKTEKEYLKDSDNIEKEYLKYNDFESYAKNEILAISKEEGDFSVKCGEEKEIKIWAIPRGSIPFLLPYEYLTFQVDFETFNGNVEIERSSSTIVIKPVKRLMKSGQGRAVITASLTANPFVETSFFMDVRK